MGEPFFVIAKDHTFYEFFNLSISFRWRSCLVSSGVCTRWTGWSWSPSRRPSLTSSLPSSSRTSLPSSSGSGWSRPTSSTRWANDESWLRSTFWPSLCRCWTTRRSLMCGNRRRSIVSWKDKSRKLFHCRQELFSAYVCIIDIINIMQGNRTLRMTHLILLICLAAALTWILMLCWNGNPIE